MASSDLSVLVQQVRAVRSAPQADLPLTSDHALNHAFADLARYGGSARPALVSLLPFWLVRDHDTGSVGRR